MKISKPGAYKTRDGRKAIVDALEATYAYGWGGPVPVVWSVVDGTVQRTNGCLDLVSEWVDPPKPVKVWLFKINGWVDGFGVSLSPVPGALASAYLTPGQFADPQDSPGHKT